MSINSVALCVRFRKNQKNNQKKELSEKNKVIWNVHSKYGFKRGSYICSKRGIDK